MKIKPKRNGTERKKAVFDDVRTHNNNTIIHTEHSSDHTRQPNTHVHTE